MTCELYDLFRNVWPFIIVNNINVSLLLPYYYKVVIVNYSLSLKC